jgi:hypothetical protein
MIGHLRCNNRTAVSLLVLSNQFPRTKHFRRWQRRQCRGETAVASLIFFATAAGAGLIAPDLGHGANHYPHLEKKPRFGSFITCIFKEPGRRSRQASTTRGGLREA